MTPTAAETPAADASLSARHTAASADVTIIRASSGWAFLNVAEIWRYRELLLVLSLREIQVRYKQTVLGVLWAVLQPLVTTGVFSVLLALLMGRGNEPTAGGAPYVVSTFCAMLPWQLFANSMSQAGNSLVANQRLITKVYFPRAIIPLSAVVGAVADFAVALVALAGIMTWYRILPGWQVVLLPLFLILAMLASVAAGLWLSAATALYRDFRYVVPFMVQIGLFVSPVIYSSESIRSKLPGWAVLIYSLNPIAGVIDGFRWSLLPGVAWPGMSLAGSAISTLCLLIAGAAYFRRMERSFADRV